MSAFALAELKRIQMEPAQEVDEAESSTARRADDGQDFAEDVDEGDPAEQDTAEVESEQEEDMEEDPTEYGVDAIKWAKWRDSRKDPKATRRKGPFEGWHYGMLWEGYLRYEDENEESIKQFSDWGDGQPNPASFWKAVNPAKFSMPPLKGKQREPPGPPPDRFHYDKTGYVFQTPEKLAMEWIREAKGRRYATYVARMKRELAGEPVRPEEDDYWVRKERLAAKAARAARIAHIPEPEQVSSSKTVPPKQKKKRIVSPEPGAKLDQRPAQKAGEKLRSTSPTKRNHDQAEAGMSSSRVPPKKPKPNPPNVITAAPVAEPSSTAPSARTTGSILQSEMLKGMTFGKKSAAPISTPMSAGPPAFLPGAPAAQGSFQPTSMETMLSEPLFLPQDESPLPVKEEPSFTPRDDAVATPTEPQTSIVPPASKEVIDVAAVPSSDEAEEQLELDMTAVDTQLPAAIPAEPIADATPASAAPGSESVAQSKPPSSPKARAKYQQPKRIQTINDAGEAAVASRMANLAAPKGNWTLPDKPASPLPATNSIPARPPPNAPTGPSKPTHPSISRPFPANAPRRWAPTGTNAVPLSAPAVSPAYQPRAPPAVVANPYALGGNPYAPLGHISPHTPTDPRLPQQTAVPTPNAPVYDASRDPRRRNPPALSSVSVSDSKQSVGSTSSLVSPYTGAGGASPFGRGGMSPLDPRMQGGVSPYDPRAQGSGTPLQGGVTPIDPRTRGGMSPLYPSSAGIHAQLPPTPMTASALQFRIKYAYKNEFESLTSTVIQLAPAQIPMMEQLLMPVITHKSQASIFFEEEDLYHLEWQLKNGSTIQEWTKLVRPGAPVSTDPAQYASLRNRLTDPKKVFVAYTESREPISRHYALVIANASQLEIDKSELSGWQKEHIGPAMLLISLPLDSGLMPDLPNPVATAWPTADRKDEKPAMNAEHGPVGVLPSYDIGDDFVQSLRGRYVAVLPPKNGALDRLYASLAGALLNVQCQTGLRDDAVTDAVLLGNSFMGDTIRNPRIERRALPRRTKFYAFGPSLQLPPTMWGLRQIWQSGGLVTFSPTFILRSPDKFGEIMAMIRTSPNWAAYIIPSVLEWTERSWTERARCPDPLKAYDALVRSLFIDQGLLHISGSAATSNGGLGVSTAPPPHTLPEACMQWTIWLHKVQQQTEYRALVDTCRGVRSGHFIGDAAGDHQKPTVDELELMDIELEQLEDLVGMRMRPHVVPYRRYLYIGEMALDKEGPRRYSSAYEHIEADRFAAILSASV